MSKIPSFAVLLLIFPAFAWAEYPVGTVQTNLCHLEVRRAPYGTGQPTSYPIIHQDGPANAGEVFMGNEGDNICWHREGNPGDCNSAVPPNYYCHSTMKGISEGQPSAFDIQ